jgi:hypothetical protein
MTEKFREVKTIRSDKPEQKHTQEGESFHVYPAKWKGEKKEPSFYHLQGAYYGSGTGDWSVVRERTIKTGDIIEVHAGFMRLIASIK